MKKPKRNNKKTSVCSENILRKNVKQLKENVILKEISLENVSFLVLQIAYSFLYACPIKLINKRINYVV